MQGTHETDFRTFCGITSLTEVQILVAVGDTGGETSVESLEHRMSGVVRVVAECGYTIVTPRTECLVRGKFVGVEQLAHKTGCTAVKTVNVAVAVCTAVAGECHVGVALVEQSVKVYLGVLVGV